MKQVIEATGTPVLVTVKAGKIFSWQNVAKVYNRIPMDICECKNVEDAKGYTKVFIVMIIMLLLAGMEGGTL